MKSINKIRTLSTTLLLCIGLSTAFLTPGDASGQEGGTSNIITDSLSDLYTVSGVGLAGCVLGLSTLSFLDQPGENLKNIVTGGAIGVIVGVGIVAWGHAGKSKVLYDSANLDQRSRAKKFFEENKLFAEMNKRVMHQHNPYYVSYKFTF